MDHGRSLGEHHRGLVGGAHRRVSVRSAAPSLARGVTRVSVIIRDATAGDARSIGEVRVASWRWAYRGQLPDEILDGLSAAEDEARLTAWFQNPEARAALLVACGEDGRILGFANAGPSRDEGATPETGEPRAIYVLKDVLGSGVGRAL